MECTVRPGQAHAPRDSTTTAVLSSVVVWREELLELLDARYLSRQQFRETFERDSSLGLRLSITEHGEENNNSARAVILCLRFIAVPPWW